MVPKKKPDPAIYLMAAEELGVSPARCGRQNWLDGCHAVLFL